MTKKTIFIMFFGWIFAAAGAANAASQIVVQDITPSAPIIKKGRLFSIEITGNTPETGMVYVPGLVYSNGSRNISPLGDIQLVGKILAAEGFEWGEDPDSKRALLRSVLMLFEGWSGRSLVDRHYYLARLLPGAADTDSIQRLQNICSEPKFTVENKQWNLVLYQIRECIGECPVFRYVFSGSTSPFTLDAVHLEQLKIVPSIVFKEPLPR